MREVCRICARELCGNQRRWIFHPASKLNLQVLLSHVLGKELCRDGKAEFACSKCAFMLDRVYRFDTVIARIEALSIERLQKLLLEKDRLKFCIASLYRRNNGEELSPDDKVGDGTVDLSSLPDVRYTALLQEDFVYSGFECWMEHEEQASESHSCHASESGASRPRRCRGCAALRVADSDYEAICKIPRKVARSISCGPSSRWSASMCNEEPPVGELGATESPNAKVPVDGESMEEGTPGSSIESLDTTVEVGSLQQKEEEVDKGGKGSGKCDYCSDDRTTPNSSLNGNRLELALSLIKTCDYKPVQSPKGSRLPVLVKSKLSHDTMDGSPHAGLMMTGSGFLNADVKSFSRPPLGFPLEMSDLQELWEDLCEEYMPLQVQNLHEDHQQLTQCEPAATEHVSRSHVVELQDRIQQFDATNKLLQEKLNELNFELKSVQETSRKQDRTIQSLNETLKSKDCETEELYHMIEGQNETMAKLRDMLHRSQLGHLQISENPSPAQQQQVALLELQNTLFCTQLEVQKGKRAQRQKEHQLAEARRALQLLETAVQEEQQQQEAAWKHNQELRGFVQKLQAELKDKGQQLQNLEWEKCRETQAHEQRLQCLSQSLALKEQLLQESRELRHHHQSLDKSPAVANAMLEKLQQRVKDRDAALERAVDDKFCVLEEKEQELQQLHLSIRERECDLERLRSILSSNEATIHSLESLLKAKTLELEQASATCQNLQWMKEEVEAKSSSRQKEQEGIVQQLQTSLHDRNKEVEELTATLLCKLGPGQSEITEELCVRLQRKERMLQDLLNDRSRQVVEHESEIRGLLQAISAKEERSRIAAEKMVQALAERSCELQILRQQMMGKELGKNHRANAKLFQEDGEQPIQDLLQGGCGDTTTSTVSKGQDSKYQPGRDIMESAAELEKELVNAKEELELMARKERESRLELSALQSVVATQEEELQVQVSDVESLTRKIQIKEDLIKDLQMQLVDPEEIPAMDRLTQEVLMLREKVSITESRGQEAAGNRRQQLLLMLEGLVAERNRLNEALQAERQLYSSLVKFHTHPDSSERNHTLQVELEGVQALRDRLEEALGRSLERLSRLETQGAIGGQHMGEDTEDTSTEFTDSIEEEAPTRSTAAQTSQGGVENKLEVKDIQSDSLAPALLESLQMELLWERSQSQQIKDEKRKVEGELRELKAQLEEAGFSSVSHIRKAMLSLCLENAELKEQVGEATSSVECGEREEEKADAGAGEAPKPELRRLQRKLRNAETIIALLKEQLVLHSREDKSGLGPQITAGLAREVVEQLHVEAGTAPAKRPAVEGQPHEDVAKRPCPQSPDLACGPPQALTEGSQAQASLQSSFWTRLGESGSGQSAQQRLSQPAQGRQHYQELQDKLAVSEATVRAQAEQLEQYRTLLNEPLVQQDSKQVQVDLQDLGYETCGRSETEADREETTSPECEEPDVFSEASLTEELSAQCKLFASAVGRSPLGAPLKSQLQILGSDQLQDIAVLQQHIQDLRAQLQNANKVIQSLQCRARSFSATSDYASGAERPHKLKPGCVPDGSPARSATEEDEGWQSDGFSAFCPPALQASRDLERLVQRVSLLEAQLPKPKPGGILPQELRSAVWPGKYDSLIQAQARELSHLRQKLREGRGVSHTLTQHLKDTTKSFEELLRGTDIDYYMGQSFREHLAQGSQLAERLSSKLSSRDRSAGEDKSGHELLAIRLSKELQEKKKMIETLEAKLQECSESVPSSRAASESPRSDSSASFLSDGLEACSDMDAASEYTQYQEEERNEQPSRCHSDLVTHSGNGPALSSNSYPATASHEARAESIRDNPTTMPSSQHHPMDPGQACTGLLFNSLSKPFSLPLPPFAPGPSSFLPAGSSPFAPPPLLGCCGTPVFSLAEVQQELQMLQKQLGESVTLTVPPVKAASLTSTFNEASPSSSSHCLHAAHMAPPQPHPLQSLTQPHRKVEASFVDSGALWDLPHLSQPQKGTFYGELSSGSSGYPSSQKLTGADLLEEHLAEIRSLRQRLEESICTNDRLREQLENRIASTTKSNGSPTNIYIHGLEPTSQLSSENRALREDNKSLQLQLDHLSRELECLRETLLTTHSRLQDAQAEQEQQQAEQQRLVEEVQEKQQSALQLREEQLALQEKNNRLQRTVTLLQQQCEENRLVFQALRSELRVYETLFGPSKVAMSGCIRDLYWKQPSSSDLDALLAEVRALRSQLLQGIQVNSSLRQQLEQQQEGRASLVTHGSTSHVFAANKPPGDRQLFQESVPSPPVRDVGMSSPAPLFSTSSLTALGPDASLHHQAKELCKEDPSVRKGSPSLKGDDPTGSFASKHGCHIIGHVDDYSTLKQQILEGKILVHKMASLMRPALSVPSLEAQGMEALERGSIRQLFGSTGTLHQILEECASLLSLFWRAALPAASSPAQHRTMEQVMKEEILELRAQLLKKETLLQSMAERLQSTSRLKENMEHFIISHLTKTHDVLKKARTNLEKSTPQSSVKSPPFLGEGETPVGTSQPCHRMSLACQEPGRKRSHPNSLPQQEEQSRPCFIHLHSY
ncbi:PREDICTED: myomegalin-like isoform X2 [Gavialis gangeticus]|uniref:myomegalin-like isoform X2 n=1 Tax=Gavialis gangeticus TaxID=94835 RepID=UPI00092FBF53|nr:PREDICTED: myomegalin-like isoform X2 [Gavialis gangeticus]